MVGGVLKFIILVDNVVIDRYEMNDSNGGRNTGWGGGDTITAITGSYFTNHPAQVKFLSLKPSQKVTIQVSFNVVLWRVKWWGG